MFITDHTALCCIQLVGGWEGVKRGHMGPEQPGSFEEVARTRNYKLRKCVFLNQTYPVLGQKKLANFKPRLLTWTRETVWLFLTHVRADYTALVSSASLNGFVSE